MHKRKKIHGRGYGHDTLAVVASGSDGRKVVLPADRICSISAVFSPRREGDSPGLQFNDPHLAGVSLKRTVEDMWQVISAELDLDTHFAHAEFGARLYPYEATDPESAAVQAFLEAALSASGREVDETRKAALITEILGRPAPVSGPRATLRGPDGEPLQTLEWPDLYGLTVLPTARKGHVPAATDGQVDALAAATSLREVGEISREIVTAAAAGSALLSESLEVAPYLTGRPELTTCPHGGAVFLYENTDEGRRAAHEAAWELRRRFPNNHVRGCSSWKGEQ